jgi:flagellin
VLTDPNQAAQIADAALQQVTTVQGRLGAFQTYQVGTSLSLMETLQEGLTEVRSTIADTDYATETANLNRQNVLMQAAITLLGMANQQQSSVLNLLM